MITHCSWTDPSPFKSLKDLCLICVVYLAHVTRSARCSLQQLTLPTNLNVHRLRHKIKRSPLT